MRASELEGSQPHVALLLGYVLTVEELVDCPEVALHAWEPVDARWVGKSMLLGAHLDERAELVEQLNAVQADVVRVTMRRVQVDPNVQTDGQAGGFVLLLDAQ